MDKETKDKIRRWEAERDRNLRIRCPHVAEKFQRWIDNELKSEDEIMQIDSSLFPEVTWENSPKKVKLTIEE